MEIKAVKSNNTLFTFFLKTHCYLFELYVTVVFNSVFLSGQVFFKHVKMSNRKTLFAGVLSPFQGFLKKMQHEKPMAHLLHVEMVALVRELLSKFMNPEAIPLSAKDIIKVDVRSRDLQLSDKGLSVGRYCYPALNKACVERKIWVKNIYNSLREGYMKSSEFPF